MRRQTMAMDASELLAMQHCLNSLLEGSPGAPLAADALISAFAAAAARGVSYAVPFPPDLPSDRRAEEALRLVQGLPPVDELQALLESAVAGGTAGATGEPMPAHLSDGAWRLLRWLLLQLAPQRGAVRAVPVAAAEAAIGVRRGVLGDCACVLEVSPPLRRPQTAPQQQQQQQSHNPQQQQAHITQQQQQQQQCPEKGLQESEDGEVWAFHGTPFPRLHSILHTGLLVATGTRAAANGALFGAGVYAATDFGTAFAFTQAAPGWSGSALGEWLRCLLVCRVAPRAAGRASTAAGGTGNWLGPQHQTGAGGEGAGSSRRTGGSGAALPEKYLVIADPSDITVRYVLLYCDDTVLGRGGTARRRRSSACSGGGSLAFDAASGGVPGGGGGGGAQAGAVGPAAVVAGGRVGRAAVQERVRRFDACAVLVVAYAVALVLPALLRALLPRGPIL